MLLAKSTIRVTSFLISLIFLTPVLADEIYNTDVIANRLQKEQKQENNPFLLSVYKPNYLLPFYSVGSPYTASVDGANRENLKREEVKFQLSFKVPVWRNVYNNRSTLYAAYSQLSYWQAYSRSAFFRETNYEPEIFLANNTDWHLSNNWQIKFLNLGMVHQSNGRGGNWERSWNRIYGEVIIANENWMLNLKPWYVIRDASYRRQNGDMANYLGYDQIVLSYKYHNQTFALEKTNIEKGFSRGAIQATWSFPITAKIKGYIQYFDGYGQSLIEYNHRTHSVGIGIALNDWI